MGLVFILQVLVLGMCGSLVHGATFDACMMVLLSEEFYTTCSTLGRNHTRPCLVQSDQDVVALKLAKVIPRRLSVPKIKICAARTETGEADCISVHLKFSTQQTWQWTEWSGTSPNIRRRFIITEGSTTRLCPYEERYFIPETFVDCLDALNQRMLTSGVYTISPDGITELQVYCEQELDGGGWTVVQRRQNGEVDFYRTWAEYKAGFGELEGEFWLGNDDIYALTKNHDQQLKFQLGSSDGQWTFADYLEFWIGDETENYKLHVGLFTGTAGDSMAHQNGMIFTTMDRDNDLAGYNCAIRFKGAWWHKACHQSNLNGIYGNTAFGEGLVWMSWKGQEHSMAYTAMMVRRKGG